MRPRLAALASTLLAAACAQPPTAEIAITAAKIDRAREVGAAELAPDLLREAEEALAEARGHVASDRRYRAALERAAFAAVRAEGARRRAEAERRRIGRTAVRLLREIEALLDEAASRGARARDPDRMAAFAERRRALDAALGAGRLVEAERGAAELKAEILRFLEAIP